MQKDAVIANNYFMKNLIWFFAILGVIVVAVAMLFVKNVESDGFISVFSCFKS